MRFDVPQSLRQTLRNKRYAFMAVACLALAISLNTTMYSVLDALMFPRVALYQPDRLFRMGFFGDMRRKVPPADRKAAVLTATTFSGMARVTSPMGNTIAERGARVRQVSVLIVSSNYFAVLGSTPTRGRLLSQADEGALPQPVVIGERLWNQLFAGRASLDSATLLINGEPRVVVGILDSHSDLPGSRADVWELPKADDLAFVTGPLNVVRLKDGIELKAASDEMQHIAGRIAVLAGQKPSEARFNLRPVIANQFHFQNFHFALIGAVLAVLLVACFNLANLQLARGLTRMREFATRAAIGATRGDIIRQLLAETAWLAGAGLTLGLILTAWGMKFVTTTMPPTLSQYFVEPQVSWRLLVFAMLAGLLCLAFIGVLPAVKLSRFDIGELIKAGTGTGANRRTRQQYGILVVLQVGFALPLLVGAALLTRAAVSMYQLDVNPFVERLVSGYAAVRRTNDADHRLLSDIAGVLVARARSIPGVEDAATTWSRTPAHQMITVYDEAGQPREIASGTFRYQVASASVLRTFGVPIVRGRDFTEGEFKEAVAIIDERTALYLWPGVNPVGQMLLLGSASRRDGGWLKVVGVHRYINTWGGFSRANQEERLAPSLGAVWVLNGTDTSHVSGVPLTTSHTGRNPASISLLVRGSSRMERLPPLLKNALENPGAGVSVETSLLSADLSLDVVRQRQDFIAALFSAFALLGMALAALGVYAIVSHSVSQRMREFGVRVALGATEGHIRRSVLFEGNVLALLGIAVGLAIIGKAAGLLQAFLQSDTARYDAWLFGLVALGLFGVTLFASWIPARRAMRINPVEALRND